MTVTSDARDPLMRDGSQYIESWAAGSDMSDLPHPPHDQSKPTSFDILRGVSKRSVSSEANFQDFNDEQENLNDEQGLPSDKLPRWSPFWLRQPVLTVFGTLFLCLTITLPLMLLYSERHNGLFETRESYLYVWRFAPTAIFTLIALFWSRVEWQVRRYMPWIAIKLGIPMGPQGFGLDYTQMIPTTVLWESIRRKHFLVTFVTFTSLVVKVQVILSPSLFFLDNVGVINPIPIQVLDSFAINSNITNGTTDSAYYKARALHDFDMMFPFGLSKGAAYQTFTRGTLERPVKVAVDGLFINTTCLPLKDYSVTYANRTGSDRPSNSPNPGYTIRAQVNMTFDGCEDHVIRESTRFDSNDKDWERSTRISSTWGVQSKLSGDPRPCQSLPQKYPQFLYYGNRFNWTKGAGHYPELDAAGGVICTPSAWVSKVEVVDNGLNPNITMLENQEKVPIKSDPWTLISAATPGMGLDSWSNYIQGPLTAGFGPREGLNNSDKAIYNSELLEESVMNLTKYFAPMVAHTYLREGNGGEVEGHGREERQKLFINQGVCFAIMALFVVCFFVTAWALFQLRQAGTIWHRDPATILGSLLFFYSESPLYATVAALLPSGGQDRKALWSHTTFTPIVLRLWARMLFLAVLVILIICLLVLLKISQKSDGLATIIEERYTSLAWKSIPTMTMLCVAVYVAACDTAIRDLATYSILSTRPCQAGELDMSLSDMLGVSALYESIRIGLPAVAVALSQTLAIFCGFLTTITAVLFTLQTIPYSENMQFQQSSWFGALGSMLDSDTYDAATNNVRSLIIQNRTNLTYPQNTYANLVFPALDIDRSLWLGDVVINITTPAARIQPTCTKLSSKDFYFNTTNRCTVNSTYCEAVIGQPHTCPNGTDTVLWEDLILGDSDRDEGDKNETVGHFAHAIEAPRNKRIKNNLCNEGLDKNHTSLLFPSWVQQTYVWGKVTYKDVKIDHLEVWTCNYSWTAVETQVNLLWTGEQVAIDHNHPPVADNSTAKPWQPPFSLPYFLGEPGREQRFEPAFPSVQPGDGAELDFSFELGPEFDVILEPYGPIRVADFGEDGHADDILSSLHFNVGLISAQLANIGHRLSLDEKSAVAPTEPGNLASVRATLTHQKRQRLVQNSAITYVLIGILALCLVVNGWGSFSILIRQLLGRQIWLLDIDLMQGLAPEDFSNIAMTEALLRGSNFFSIRSTDAYLAPGGEIMQSLAGIRFRMGWFARAGTETEDFTIGVLEDPKFPFSRAKVTSKGLN